MKTVLSDYNAACSLEPHHPSLKLGIWSAELGKDRFAGGELFTSDTSTDDHRGGRGHYYRPLLSIRTNPHVPTEGRECRAS